MEVVPGAASGDAHRLGQFGGGDARPLLDHLEGFEFAPPETSARLRSLAHITLP
jgi:hypothetical protein